MNDNELLNTPLSQLSPEQKIAAIDAYDRMAAQVRAENAVFVPSVSIGFAVISDDLGVHGIKSMADGKQYDSKSAYYKSLKSQGYEVVAGDSKFKNPTAHRRAVDEGINWGKELKKTMEGM